MKLFSEEPKIKESRNVIVPTYDPYFKKHEDVPGVLQIFETPVPQKDQWIFGSIGIYHQPKFHSIDVTPMNIEEVDQATLLKIADFFGIKEVKIKTMYQRGCPLTVGKPKEKIEAIQHHLSYGPESYDWNEEDETFPTIECDLEIQPSLCYGVTTYREGNEEHEAVREKIIIHTTSYNISTSKKLK